MIGLGRYVGLLVILLGSREQALLALLDLGRLGGGVLLGARLGSEIVKVAQLLDVLGILLIIFNVIGGAVHVVLVDKLVVELRGQIGIAGIALLAADVFVFSNALVGEMLAPQAVIVVLPRIQCLVIQFVVRRIINLAGSVLHKVAALGGPEGIVVPLHH